MAQYVLLLAGLLFVPDPTQIVRGRFLPARWFADGGGSGEELEERLRSARPGGQRHRHPDGGRRREGLVLTAAHLFEGKIGPITVEFKDGQISGARILAIDRKLDVAALWIYAPKGIRPVPIADHDPQLGEQVEIWGYGPKRFRSFVARVAKPIPLEGDVPEALVAAQGVENKQVTIPGDSGGPMVCDGSIVAVHWGYRGGEDDPRRCVHALGCGKLRDWLKTELTPSIWRRVAFAN